MRKVEDIPGRNEFLARNVNSLELNGKYSIYDVSKESLEVNKLARWYKVTPHEESCYRKLELILKDNNDEEYDSLTFEKAFMVDYSEVFNFERSTIDFYALIREFKEEILKADGKSVGIGRISKKSEVFEKDEVTISALPMVEKKKNDEKKEFTSAKYKTYFVTQYISRKESITVTDTTTNIVNKAYAEGYKLLDSTGDIIYTRTEIRNTKTAGKKFIQGFELTMSYAVGNGLVEKDLNNKVIGLYPYYAGDNSITIGIGVSISNKTMNSLRKFYMEKLNITNKNLNIGSEYDFNKEYESDYGNITKFKAKTGATNKRIFPVRVPGKYVNYLTYKYESYGEKNDDEVTELFNKAVVEQEEKLNKFLDNNNLKIFVQNQYDALLSLLYNAEKWIYDSNDGLNKALKQKDGKNGNYDLDAVSYQIAAKGGDKTRRAKEASLFKTRD